MAEQEQVRDRRGSFGRRGGDTGAEAPGPGSGDAAARARAYLDLWERNLVHSAVKGRHGPPARAPAGPGSAPPRP